MNGIDLIVADHRTVDGLFAEFDEHQHGDVIGRVLDALTAHDEAEQAALYPLAEAVLGRSKLLGQCMAAHSQLKTQMDRVRQLEGAPLVAAFTALRTLVQAHVRDEESRLLPELATKATAAQLDQLAARIGHVKQRVG